MASAAATATLPPSSISVGSSPAFSSSKDSLSLPAIAGHQLQRNSFSRSLAFSPLSVKSSENERGLRIVAMATGESSDPSEAVQDVLKSIQEAWDKTEDKLAVGGLGFAALIVLWASAGLIGAIDKLPLIPNFFEFVGLVFTGWFIYRYLLFKPDREELVKKVEKAWAKISGSEV